MIEVGKSYYLVPHPYYHYVGTVEAIEGPDKYRLRNCVRVNSDSPRDYTSLFRDGFARSTVYTCWPDGTTVTGPFIVEAPWNHEIPGEK